MVDSQNISDSDSASATSAHGVAAAPGSLNPSFSSAVGPVWCIAILLYWFRVIALAGPDAWRRRNSSPVDGDRRHCKPPPDGQRLLPRGGDRLVLAPAQHQRVGHASAE